MALGNAKNIIVGAGAVYIGTQNDEKTEQDLVSTGTFEAATGSFQDADNVNSDNWSSVGYTSEGAELSFEPDYGEVQVDQLLDVAKIFKQGQRVMVNTTLTEATLENMVLVLGATDSGSDPDLSPTSTTSAGSSQVLNLNGGSLGYAPLERSICIVGPGPDSKVTAGKSVERVYVGYRALSMETVAVGIRRNEATVFPVSFRLLPSSINEAPDGNASYGKIIDRVFG